MSAVLAATVGLFCASGLAQQTNAPAPPPSAGVTNTLPTVVVTASPLPSDLFDLAQPVTVMTGQRLARALTSTLGETLGREPGISSSYYGPNSSRPIIRGLDRDHIRLIQNGVSMMDASAVSVDHTVAQDPLTITRVEVVRGPAALLYGPTAVGGVVNTIDNRIPDVRMPSVATGKIEGRYSSVDSGRSLSGVIEGTPYSQGAAGFNFHLDGFERANSDLTIPGFARSRLLRETNPLPPGEIEPRDTLENSQADSRGGSAGTSYVWEKGYVGGAFQTFNNHYGTVAEEDVTIRMFQRRWDLAGAFYDPAKFLQSIKWKFGSADYKQTEFENPVPGTVFTLDSINARVEALHAPLGKFEGAVGYEARHEDLRVTGDEAFLPPTDTMIHSAFIFEEVKWEKARLQFGARMDHTVLAASEDSKFGSAKSETFATGSGSAGIVLRLNENFSQALNLSYTQRAPVHQELFANGADLGAGAFLIGTADLEAERSYGIDLTLRKESATGGVTGSVTCFYTRFENFISPEPIGAIDPTFKLPIYKFRGVPAEFAGVETSVTVPLLVQGQHRLELELKSDFTRATNTDTDEPLPRIPPLRFGANLSYEKKDQFSATLEFLRAQPQHRVTANELPTDGYSLIDISFTIRLGTGPVMWDLLIKGSNLLDEDARLHTSFLKDIAPLPGRGASVALRASF